MELIERLVLSISNEGDGILDPFLGAGTSIIVAIRHARRGAGAKIEPKYIDIAREAISKPADQSRCSTTLRRPGKIPFTWGGAPWHSESHNKKGV
ncbi:MAG: DNA methyltransferase [Lentisphaeria bacterium]